MKFRRWIGGWCGVGLCLSGVAASAQVLDQTIPLQNGWNAVFLELEPTNRTPAVLFANLPISSVWTYKTRLSTVQFVQSQSETNFNTDEWMVYFPTNRPESFRNTMFGIIAQRAYLIRCTNAATLTVTGRAVWRPAEWIPNDYNLKGFAINPSGVPTFKGFFQASTAHYNSATDSPYAIYRLQANGQWALVNSLDTMKRGEAYWVMCRGGSDYAGPLELQLLAGDSLDFGESSDQLLLRLKNRSAAAMQVSLSDRRAGTPISYGAWTATAGNTWVSLANSLTLTLNAGDINTVRLSVNRSQFAGSNYLSVLDVATDAGATIALGVAASKQTAPNTGGSSLAGLWVGNASIEEVSEPANINTPTNTTPVKNPMTLRLLIHVDDGGKARLLKEVIQMLQPASYTNAPNGLKAESSPAKPVLLTDDRLISQYQGGVLKGGKLVGRRWSTAAYDFEGGTNRQVLMDGSFAAGHQLSVTLNIPSALPTNPFLHRYHPDHDNLDERFQGSKEEAYPFARQMVLTLGNPDNAEPGSGYRVMTGVYQEKVTGVHRGDIYLKGTFQLQRVVNVGVLNVAP